MKILSTSSPHLRQRYPGLKKVTLGDIIEDSGVDRERVCEADCTALILSCFKGPVRVLRLLVSNASTEEPNTGLARASRTNGAGSVKSLCCPPT